VLATTRKVLGGTDMMVDYDHQSALSATAGVGGTAKAAGWVKDLRIGDEGIYASVEWTPPAEEALKNREYRYVSPHFRYLPGSGEVTRIVNIGLTGTPNLDLPALAHVEGSAPHGANHDMTMIALAPLCAALSLADGAGETQVLAAIGRLRADREAGQAALNATRTALGLGADVGTDAVLAAVASSASPDPEKFVPKAGFDAVQAELRELKEERVLASVDDAVASGRVPPSMKDWALDLGRKDVAALNAYLAAAVPFQGGAAVLGEPAGGKAKLTDEEAAICAQLGLSEADFIKSRDEGNV
jgi:phage I-like protein